MIEKLTNLVKHYELVVNKMSDPKVVSDIEKYTELAKEHRQLTPIIDMSKQYISLYNNLKEDEEILLGDDVELKEIVKEEISDLKKDLKSLEEKLKIKLLPKDPNDDKNIILEIRSGTGGNEASLFANDLFRMYARYSENKKWNTEVLSINENDGGGIKEVVISVQGNGAFGYLKYESGVHRVQRIPETESNGRVHTSAATVAVLPEAEEVDIDIQETDIKIDTYRASGAGGQHVNKTESAIRITHIPSNLIVTCQDESSQHKNRDKAMKVLRARLFDLETEKLNKQRSDKRKEMVSTGDRSAKIRTYNYPQGRVTDHRINLTLYKLDEIMDGSIMSLIEPLQLEDQKLKLENISE
ncbi:MAG: peptide chain release factor 1 [Candidatus Marinimicrobia bacterium]|nr:peptide chain release factor 1 [Candidatus Neomarinimicrobiota bacterium]|tara:strand:+ start:706 stop:1773 length:1068 start_codon:yes stop_codon:yes gene_type:complete